MSTAGNGQAPVYQVTFSGQTRERARQLHQEAAESGAGQQFVQAMRTIVQRLQSEPMNFGEPLDRLPSLKLQVRQGIVAPVVVDFAVHEERPLVFIRGLKLLS